MWGLFGSDGLEPCGGRMAHPIPWAAPKSARPRGYTASTVTTPGTALMAPAICGETLKRPAYQCRKGERIDSLIGSFPARTCPLLGSFQAGTNQF